MSPRSWFCLASLLALVSGRPAPALAQQVTIDTSTAGRQQIVDGFGTCLGGDEGQQQWFQDLYYGDLGSSLLRFDITPAFKSPYSDHHYNSPWFSNDPPLPGPEGNNVRTYTDAASYTRLYAGTQAKIAVMGPNIDENIKLLDLGAYKTAGLMAQRGLARKAELGDFKLFASMWSPAPWLKLSSGNKISGHSGIYPVTGTPWPFIWGGNFAGGVLDVSGTPRAELNDSSLGGSGPTSALTQYARGLVAFLRGFQNTYNVKLYAISLQNEINFEEFYNSCRYPLASDYIAVLKVARAELDRYPDLKEIRIEGPEDLLGNDGWSLWQYGGGATPITHKNLQYLANIFADPIAAKALDFFSIHGYAANGVSSAGADPQAWSWWVNGWTTAPAQGLPAKVDGIKHFGKKSWMTETSGEPNEWLSPATGFPGAGAFSIALKIHQALTVGRESAWIYWQLSDGKAVNPQTLTDATLKAGSPKLVAAQHFFKLIRPNSQVVSTQVSGSTALKASAYVHDGNGTLTIVLINASATALTATVALPGAPAGLSSFEARTSAKDSYFKPSTLTASDGKLSVPVPGWGVVTLLGQGTPAPVKDGGPVGGELGSPRDGAASSGDGGSGDAASGAPRGDDGCGCVVGSEPAPIAAGGALALLGLGLLWRRGRTQARVRG